MIDAERHLSVRGDGGIGPASELWEAVLMELATLQDRQVEGFKRPLFNPYTDERLGDLVRTEETVSGSIFNPSCGFPTVFDTACGARAFLAEYRRTGESEWQQRTTRALESLQTTSLHEGVPEPRWDPIGWYYDEGSLFATGVVLDNYWETLSLLDRSAEVDTAQWETLGTYLERCRHGPGKFAHNSVPPGATPGDVQNTTAFALFLGVYANHQSGDVDVLGRDQVDAAISHLADGQRTDGFWPYIFPSRIQRWLFDQPRLHPIVRNKIARKTVFRGDSWVFFGDSVHHCYVLYYLLKARQLLGSDVPRQVIEDGWNWLDSHILTTETDSYRFDFDWEPTPNSIRFSNFYDTTTYFFLLALLPLLENEGILSPDEAYEIADGLSRYITDRLLDTSTEPCVRIHECDYETRRKILPAVWNSSAFKAALLAQFVDVDTSS